MIEINNRRSLVCFVGVECERLLFPISNQVLAHIRRLCTKTQTGFNTYQRKRKQQHRGTLEYFTHAPREDCSGVKYSCYARFVWRPKCTNPYPAYDEEPQESENVDLCVELTLSNACIRLDNWFRYTIATPQ